MSRRTVGGPGRLIWVQDPPAVPVKYSAPLALPTSQSEAPSMTTAVRFTPTDGPVTDCHVTPPLSVNTTALLAPTATTLRPSRAAMSARSWLGAPPPGHAPGR